MGHQTTEFSDIPIPKIEKFKIPMAIKDSCEKKSASNASTAKSIFNNPAWSKQLGDTLLNAGHLRPKGIEKAVALIVKVKNDSSFATKVRTDNDSIKVGIPDPIKPTSTKFPYFEKKTIAYGHNHPGIALPSYPDLYSLSTRTRPWPVYEVKSNKVINQIPSPLSDFFIIGGDTSAFALHVENGLQSRKFSNIKEYSSDSTFTRDSTNYNGFITTSKIGKMFKEAKDYFKDSLKYTETQSYAWAFAHILKKSESGIKLLVRDKNGNFLEINTYLKPEDITLPDGTKKRINRFLSTICKQ